MTPPGFVATASALWLAHVLSDFVFQTSRVMASKRRLELAGYLWHGGTHFLIAVVCTGIFLRFGNLSLRVLLILGALAAVHAALDYVRSVWTRAGVTESPGPFFLDQAWHALTILAAAWWIARPGAADLSRFYASVEASRDALLAAFSVYTTVVFAGGYAVRNLTKPLLEGVSVEEGRAYASSETPGCTSGGSSGSWLFPRWSCNRPLRLA